MQAKILQLTGNKSLECLLELVKDKLSGNMLFVNSSTGREKNKALKVKSDRITKVEQMFETLLQKKILTKVKVNQYVAIVAKLIMWKVRASD